MFPIVPVDSRTAVALEPLGTKRNFWYLDGAKRMLFKAEERGTGDDWAEKIACELCRLLGLPHVHYELAHDEVAGVPGVVCETFAPWPRTWVPGNEMMQERDAAYPLRESNRFKVREHTIDAVADVVRQVAPPPDTAAGSVSAGRSALEVFAGYILLDAWIANQDRHHENWGVVREESLVSLAPTFDHGASQARNLTDEERHERLTSRDANRQVQFFSRRARSAFFGSADDRKPLTTVAAWRAFSSLVPDAARMWLDRLAGIDDGTVDTLLHRVPPSRMSEVCRTFTSRLLAENRERLLMGEEK